MNTIVLPTTLSEEEHKLKEIHEKFKQMKRLIGEQKRLRSRNATKIEKNGVRKSIEQAAVATEELKRKVIAGAITVKKVDEKHTFKRCRVDRKHRTTSDIEDGEILDRGEIEVL